MGFVTNELQGIGNTNLSGDTFIDGVLTVNADQYLSGNTYISGICEIDGDLTVDADIETSGNLTVGGPMYINGALAITNDFTCAGQQINGSIYINDFFGPDSGANFTSIAVQQSINPGDYDYGMNNSYSMEPFGTLKVSKGLIMSGSTFSGMTSRFKGQFGQAGSEEYHAGDTVRYTHPSGGLELYLYYCVQDYTTVDSAPAPGSDNGDYWKLIENSIAVDGTSGTDGSSGVDGTSGTNGNVDLTTIANQQYIFNNNGTASGSTHLQKTTHGISVVNSGYLNVGKANTNAGALGVTIGDTCTAADDGNANIAIGNRNSANYGSVVIGGADNASTTSVYGAIYGGTEHNLNDAWYSGIFAGKNNDIIGGSKYSMALGRDLTINGVSHQTAVGAFNVNTGSTDITDENSPRFVVGGGHDDASRKNAFLVRKSGDVEIAGNLSVTGNVNGFITLDTTSRGAYVEGSGIEFTNTLGGEHNYGIYNYDSDEDFFIGYTGQDPESPGSEGGVYMTFSGITILGETTTITGGHKVAVTNQTESYTGLTTDYIVTFSGTTLGYTLPESSASGRVIVIKNLSVSTVTITAQGSDLIDGEATKTLTTQYQSVTLVDSATGVWIVI